jgi:hypothetical protein
MASLESGRLSPQLLLSDRSPVHRSSARTSCLGQMGRSGEHNRGEPASEGGSQKRNWSERDSNPQGFHHRCLKSTRLPISTPLHLHYRESKSTLEVAAQVSCASGPPQRPPTDRRRPGQTTAAKPASSYFLPHRSYPPVAGPSSRSDADQLKNIPFSLVVSSPSDRPGLLSRLPNVGFPCLPRLRRHRRTRPSSSSAVRPTSALSYSHLTCPPPKPTSHDGRHAGPHRAADLGAPPPAGQRGLRRLQLAFGASILCLCRPLFAARRWATTSS